jgi:hypothetical protein
MIAVISFMQFLLPEAMATTHERAGASVARVRQALDCVRCRGRFRFIFR